MQKKSPGSIWFAVTQVGSIVYKGISYTKKAPQYLQSRILRTVSVGWGAAVAPWEQTRPRAQQSPPFSSSLAKLSFSTVHLVLLSLLVKTKSS